MKYLIWIISLAIFLTSCVGKLPKGKQPIDTQQSVSENDNQQQAMIDGRPFVGMTDKEASTALTLVSWTLKLNGKILKAQFKDKASRHYVLFFDGGTPNRLKMWSAFTDEEVEEATKLPDIRPLNLPGFEF
ncbi:MAG: hypothetical protein ACI82Z_002016 [Cellvibrionaceae bacterium]